MIQCPKCGFTQPEDRYCAQCGVNMESFEPETSVFDSIFGNPRFYLSLLVILVIFSTYFVYSRILKPISDNQLSGAIDYSSAEEINADRPRLDVARQTAQKISPPKETREVRDTRETFATTATEAALPARAKLEVRILIAPPDSSIFQSSELKDAQVGVSTSPLKPSTESGLEATVYTRSLSFNTSNLPASETIEIKGPTTEDGVSLGMTIQVSVESLENDSLSFQAQIQTRLLGSAEAVEIVQQELDVPTQSISPGESAFIFGFLPHREASEIESEMLPSQLSLIFDREDFVERATEAFLIIEYSK